MSNFPLLHYQSPDNRKGPLISQGIVSPQVHLIMRPTSTKGARKQQGSPNHFGYRNAYHGHGTRDNVEFRRIEVSPVRYNPIPEDRSAIAAAQYNFQNVMAQKRESIGITNLRAEKTPQQVRLTRDISPLGKGGVFNEGVEYPPRAVRIDERGMKGGERDGSWNRLLNRAQEQAASRNQKINDWRKVLDDQVRERQLKKLQEEERKRNEEEEAENRFQRQIEELSSEIEKKKQSLNKNGGLRQGQDQKQENRYEYRQERSGQLGGNAGPSSPLGQLNVNVVNLSSKSHKDLRRHRENLSQVFSPSAVSMNVREKRGKSNYREDGSIHINFSAEKNGSRNETINQLLDNLKAELLQGHEVFKGHIKDLKDEQYRLGKFRNLAERNLLGAQRAGFVKGGTASLPANMIYKEIYGIDEEVDLSEPYKPSKKSQLQVDQEEEKFKWDADDFYAKLPPSKQMLTGVQTMVKIEPISDQLLAYKKQDSSPKKKWFDDEEEKVPEKAQEKVKHLSKEVKSQEKAGSKEDKQEEKDRQNGQKSNRDKPKNGSPVRGAEVIVKDNNQALKPARLIEEDLRISTTISSVIEIKSTPQAHSKHPKIQEELEQKALKDDKDQKDIKSKPETQSNITTPKNVGKGDYLQITKDFQRLTAMLDESEVKNERAVTPSIEQIGSRKDLVQVENAVVDKAETLDLDNNDENGEKEKKVLLKVKKESRGGIESRNKPKLKTENMALKALSKFVSKDGLDAKLADKRMQGDPLARLDYMIDYLFNYDS